jgi:hypothetical protein
MDRIVNGRMFAVAFLFCTAFLLAFNPAQAQVPNTISYQGVLMDAGGAVVPDGNYSLTFRLYLVVTGGSPIWSETQSLPTGKGIFSAVLGSSTPIGLAFDRQYWLGITVGAGSELSPRAAITPAAYSFHSVRSDTASWFCVDYGTAGSMACGTPLGNGPGFILKAPNGERRDIFVGNTGTVIDYKLYVNKDGNVGIGTASWPGGKLGVNGDIFVSGNLTKMYSGSTPNNVTPTAFGNIKKNGTISTATPNVSVSWNATDSWYEIAISGVNYYFADYVTTVTPMGGTGTFLVPVTTSVSGGIVVQIFNLSGTRVQADFAFMTYKP